MANELQQPTSERLLLLLLQYQRVPPPHCVYPWVPKYDPIPCLILVYFGTCIDI